MLIGIAEWLRDFRRRRAETARRKCRANQAASIARAAFVEAYPEPDQLSDRYRSESVADGHIVTLVHGATRPPGRSWWHVDEGGAVAEMTYEQAAGQIEIPLWR